MPLQFIMECDSGYSLGLWEIHETEDALQGMLQANTIDAAQFSLVQHPTKRREFLASRLLMSRLAVKNQLPYSGISKDANGKPFLQGIDYHISLSHSGNIAVAAICPQPIGIDIEPVSPKLPIIVPRVLTIHEKADMGTSPEKACIYWTAKESIFKCNGQKGVSLKENIRIDPFQHTAVLGKLTGRLLSQHTERLFQIDISWFDGYCLAICAEKI